MADAAIPRQQTGAGEMSLAKRRGVVTGGQAKQEHASGVKLEREDFDRTTSEHVKREAWAYRSLYGEQ